MNTIAAATPFPDPAAPTIPSVRPALTVYYDEAGTTAAANADNAAPAAVFSQVQADAGLAAPAAIVPVAKPVEPALIPFVLPEVRQRRWWECGLLFVERGWCILRFHQPHQLLFRLWHRLRSFWEFHRPWPNRILQVQLPTLSPCADSLELTSPTTDSAVSVTTAEQADAPNGLTGSSAPSWLGVRAQWRVDAVPCTATAQPDLAAQATEYPIALKLPPALAHADASLTSSERMGNRVTTIQTGQVILLKKTWVMGWPMQWNSKLERAMPMLVRFHLHYHEFLEEIWQHPEEPDPFVANTKVSNPKQPVGHLVPMQVILSALLGWDRAFCADWAGRHPVAWHPYCLSRRLPVWCRLLRAWALTKEQEIGSVALYNSLATQADWLDRHLEWDLGGNHLWENAQALIIAGCFLTGPKADRWRRRGCEILMGCLASQLLPSGEHFERSPAYQHELAHRLAETASWLAPVDAETAAHFADQAERMNQFLQQLRHPNNQLPQFSDGELVSYTALPTLVRNRVVPGTEMNGHPNNATTESSLGMPINYSGWVGDYYVHRVGPAQCILDTGNLGPPELPAHAHADLLGCEFSLQRRRLLVDSGTYCYAGPKRNDYRRSAAHNVVTVDEAELADVWSTFRMGRRGEVIDRREGILPGGKYVRATHNAYRHRGITVDRIWFLPNLADGHWFSIHLIRGQDKQSHTVTEYLHWHPDICPVPILPNRMQLCLATGVYPHSEQLRSGGQIQQALLAASKSRRRQSLPSTTSCQPWPRFYWELVTTKFDITFQHGAVAEQFYQERLALVTRLHATGRLPMVCAWGLHAHSQPIDAKVVLYSNRLELYWTERQRQKNVAIPLHD